MEVSGQLHVMVASPRDSEYRPPPSRQESLNIKYLVNYVMRNVINPVNVGVYFVKIRWAFRKLKLRRERSDETQGETHLWNVAVVRVALLLCFRKVPGSYLGLETGYRLPTVCVGFGLSFQTNSHTVLSVRIRPFPSTSVLNHYSLNILFFLTAQQRKRSLGFLSEVARSHSDTPHSVGLLWTSDHPVADTSTWQHTTLTTERPRVGFEPTISAGERPQTHALDRAVTGTSQLTHYSTLCVPCC